MAYVCQVMSIFSKNKFHLPIYTEKVSCRSPEEKDVKNILECFDVTDNWNVFFTCSILEYGSSEVIKITHKNLQSSLNGKLIINFN